LPIPYRSKTEELEQSLKKEREVLLSRVCTSQDLETRLRESMDLYDTLKKNMAAELMKKDETLALKEAEIDMWVVVVVVLDFCLIDEICSCVMSRIVWVSTGIEDSWRTHYQPRSLNW